MKSNPALIKEILLEQMGASSLEELLSMIQEGEESDE